MKTAYSLAMKQEPDQSRNFQLLLVGAENTGKTSLISSFLQEEFVEGRAATKEVDVEVCKVHCKDWVKISHSENILDNQFSYQCKDNVLNTMASSLSSSSAPNSYNQSAEGFSITHSDALFTTVPLTQSIMMTASHSDTSTNASPYSQHMLKTSLQYNSDSLMASLWDFAGQTIFHNSHSVFISDSGVTLIVFNASMELIDSVIPRNPPECCTIISSIHYWLQVVNSVCSVKGNVLLVGTHIDKLHPDVGGARTIASNQILPDLEKELCDKPYAKHIACIGKGLKVALKQSCFFISNKCRDEEIQHLQACTIRVAASLRQNKPIFFLKIEKALLQLNKQVILMSTMLDLVTKHTFSFDKNSSEFKEILRYFHNNRIILHLSL